ncbi:hypothetical protein [Novibacillus thermophilus]|jgi:hypothetical protein|uniref:Transporter n=1 Tax=Novibacillus thermophilus TaxID=1471761 RepID=A0A1U9K8M5_9BACL|nr:hypothetical protein [Novibacillus thermophilus]AQS56378.1 hypothetical protein B0W44_12010 [Novibacillus thermophilus]
MAWTISHWVYLLGAIVVLFTMLRRKGVVVPSILATFCLGLTYHHSIVAGIGTIFQASLFSAQKLFNIYLIIAVMVGLLKTLEASQADRLMLRPIERWIVGPNVAFCILAIVTFALSVFFWPAPVVPLIGGLLIPAAIRVGLHPMATAMVVSLAGHGMALGGDVVIQGAPKLTAASSGLPVETIILRAGVLSCVAGIVALSITFFMMRRMKTNGAFRAERQGKPVIAQDMLNGNRLSVNDSSRPTGKSALGMAILVPIVLVAVVVVMVWQHITGDAATALLGGTAALLIILGSFWSEGWKALDTVVQHFIDGFVFAFKAMGPVIPIAGFFLLGSPDASQAVLGEQARGYLFDISMGLQNVVADFPFVTSLGILTIGMLTGLDGSGFSGLPLVGTLAIAMGGGEVDPATLASIGQIGAVWTGGGTLVAWSPIVAIAAFANVSITELVRKSFLPVITGLLVATVVGLIVW